MSRLPSKRAVLLALRERRATIEQVLLNRALRHDQGPLDRLVTRLVLTQIPSVPEPGQAGRLDQRPPRD